MVQQPLFLLEEQHLRIPIHEFSLLQLHQRQIHQLLEIYVPSCYNDSTDSKTCTATYTANITQPPAITLTKKKLI